ncbi:MAG: lysophospholipase [Gammaproteobacteria bacterium]
MISFRWISLHLTVMLLLLLAGCATPYIAPTGMQNRTPALESSAAIMADGMRLPLRIWQPPSEPVAVVLALHGLNDYLMAFNKPAQFLVNHGILVYAIDQRGFGDSHQAGLWHGSEQMVADATTVLQLIHQYYPELPLYLIGESMGGAVALQAQPANAILAGTILVAPAVWSRDSMPWYQRLALWFASHTLPGKKLTGEGLEIKPTDNMKMLRAWAADPKVIKATRVDVLYGVSNLMDSAVAAIPAVNSRILLLYGEHDDVIPEPPICSLATELTRHHKTLDTRLYPDGYHMLTRDLKADLVLSDMSNWILDKVDSTIVSRQALQCKTSN